MASTTIDPLIRIKPSDELLDVVKYLLELEKEEICKDSSMVRPSGISSLLTCSDENTFKDFVFFVEDIKWIYAKKELVKTTQNSSECEKIDWIRNKHLHELLSECEIILPQPKYPPRDPVLEARCQRLKAKQEEMEYRKMTANVDGRVEGLHKHSDTDSFSKQSKRKKKPRILKTFLSNIKNKIKTNMLH